MKNKRKYLISRIKDSLIHLHNLKLSIKEVMKNNVFSTVPYEKKNS